MPGSMQASLKPEPTYQVHVLGRGLRPTNSDGWSKVLNEQYVIAAPHIHPEYFTSWKSDDPRSGCAVDRGEFRTALGQRDNAVEIGLGWKTY